MSSFIDEDVASGLIEALADKTSVPMPDWLAVPSCRCEKPMELILVAQRPDATQVRTYACAICNHRLQLTVWSN